MAEIAGKLPHKLTLDERRRLDLTGAREVIHFDEEVVVLGTDFGVLTIHGNELRLKCLELEHGAVVIQGNIAAICYDVPRKNRGLFR